ncbi:Crp/Fnr family transcriptional regulator [Streptomyces sp. NPDC003300]
MKRKEGGNETFLRRLPELHRGELLHLSSEHRYRTGEVLMSEGEQRSPDVMILLSGLVKVTKRLGNGNEGLLAVRADGDVVGEMAALNNAPRSATVTACGEVHARIVRGEDLRTFLKARPEAMQTITEIIIQRLRRANNWRIDFGSYPVKVRLARALVDLAALYGRHGRRGIIIGIAFSQSELAGLVGSTKETTHKALAELRDAGLVEVHYARQIIMNLDRLCQIARLEDPE